MRFFKANDGTYINIDKIICIEKYSKTYPNEPGVIIYFDSNKTMNKEYVVVNDTIENVLKILRQLDK
jgi:adenylate cyclase